MEPNSLLKLWIVDCLTGKRAAVDGERFRIGSAPTSDLRVGNGGDEQELMHITRVAKSFFLYPGKSGGSLVFDGQEVPSMGIQDNSEHTVVVGGYPFLLRAGDGTTDDWASTINPAQWYVLKRGESKAVGPLSQEELPLLANGERGQIILFCTGMKQMGFFPHQIMPRMKSQAAAGPSDEVSPSAAQATEAPVVF